MMFDGLNEECGVFGVFGMPEAKASDLIYYGLFALQHRGQETAGMAVIRQRQQMLYYKGEGLVNDVFDKRMLTYLEGESGIGHVRYSTTGGTNRDNAQPLVMNYRDGKIALVHNGNLVNDAALREAMEKEGVLFQTTSDSEVILAHIARLSLQMDSLEAAVAETMRIIRGGYSIILLTQDKIIAFRDPNGLRPLSIGKQAGYYIFSSESAAMTTIGADYIRDIKPGEIVSVDATGLHSHLTSANGDSHLCSFEYIYFARPDSHMAGLSIYQARVQMGRQLYREFPVDADIVISVPDSGTPAAIGYAYESNIPFVQGFFRSPYVGRTFIKPSQEMREAGVDAKLAPLRENVWGKRIVMVDDSIVRGTTIRRIVSALRTAGAVEVHVMISSPPVIDSCYYGIDTPSRQHLIAANHTVEEIRLQTGADSLHYLSEAGLETVLEKAETGLCMACFNSKYPVPVR
jgi:amidophosphoribosyltransferase